MTNFTLKKQVLFIFADDMVLHVRQNFSVLALAFPDIVLLGSAVGRAILVSQCTLSAEEGSFVDQYACQTFIMW